MKIRLIQINTTNSKAIEELIADYTKRLGHYVSFQTQTLSLSKKQKNLQGDQLKIAEGDLILEHIETATPLILLDERGQSHSSVSFSKFIQKRSNAGPKEIVFCIGGAYGFSQEVYARANFQISLSDMTLTHQMIRLLFVEQLYRAYTIIKGEKYHH